MRRPWERRDDVSELEQRLRDERPRPSDELVQRLTQESSLPGSPASRGRYSPPRLRLGLATAVSGVVLAVVIALGGLGSPLDTAKGIVQFDNARVFEVGQGQRQGKDKGKDKGKPAKDQYDEKVTICHRPPGNPSNGQTLTLPQSGADAHLRNHSGDSLGPCPPPPPKPKPKK